MKVVFFCCLSVRTGFLFMDCDGDGNLYFINWEEGPEERCAFHPENECCPIYIICCLVCEEIYRGWWRHLCPECHREWWTEHHGLAWGNFRVLRVTCGNLRAITNQ